MIWAMVQTVAALGIIYLILCFFVSGLIEWIASARGWRGNSLKAGIRRMLPDQPIYRRVMQHTLISGMYRDQAATGRPPTSLSPANFAGAVIDVVYRRACVSDWRPRSGSRASEFRSALKAIQLDHPLIAQSLTPILDRAGDDFAAVQAGIEAWFNSAMERVGNWYNTYLRRRLFLLALAITALANLDAIAMTRGFWEAAAAPPATATATNGAGVAMPSIERARPLKLPIGYSCIAGPAADVEKAGRRCVSAFWTSITTLDGWKRLLGWLLTALAVAIGTPYLFRIVAARRS